MCVDIRTCGSVARENSTGTMRVVALLMLVGLMGVFGVVPKMGAPPPQTTRGEVAASQAASESVSSSGDRRATSAHTNAHGSYADSSGGLEKAVKTASSGSGSGDADVTPSSSSGYTSSSGSSAGQGSGGYGKPRMGV
jgi:hypothetical protein